MCPRDLAPAPTVLLQAEIRTIAVQPYPIVPLRAILRPRLTTVTMRYVFVALLLAGCATPQAADPPAHIVFVTGDEEYRSEESMPMLARILERDYGLQTTVLYAINDEGFIDPNVLDNIAGLQALEDADMMVMFTRFRALPDRSDPIHP